MLVKSQVDDFDFYPEHLFHFLGGHRAEIIRKPLPQGITLPSRRLPCRGLLRHLLLLRLPHLLRLRWHPVVAKN